MDQNAALEELRMLFGEHLIDPEDEDRARELFVALDAWLSAGNALPDDWKRRDPEPTRVPVDPFA